MRHNREILLASHSNCLFSIAIVIEWLRTQLGVYGTEILDVFVPKELEARGWQFYSFLREKFDIKSQTIYSGAIEKAAGGDNVYFCLNGLSAEDAEVLTKTALTMQQSYITCKVVGSELQFSNGHKAPVVALPKDVMSRAARSTEWSEYGDNNFPYAGQATSVLQFPDMLDRRIKVYANPQHEAQLRSWLRKVDRARNPKTPYPFFEDCGPQHIAWLQTGWVADFLLKEHGFAYQLREFYGQIQKENISKLIWSRGELLVKPEENGVCSLASFDFTANQDSAVMKAIKLVRAAFNAFGPFGKATLLSNYGDRSRLETAIKLRLQGSELASVPLEVLEYRRW